MYQFERREFPNGCLDTVTVEVVANGTLPVELMSQSSEWIGDDIKVTFTTAYRVNTHKTYAEISADGAVFVIADSLIYDTPESSVIEDHVITIEKEVLSNVLGKLQPGRVIYLRLRNLDLDGSQQYPGPAMVVNIDNISPGAMLAVYPNPALIGQPITIEGSSIETSDQYTMISPAGQAIHHGTISYGKLTVPDNIRTGMYVLKIYSGSSEVGHTLIIVE